jgi:adenylylsulfate kinase
MNLTWHSGEIDPKDRERIYGHSAACVWLTGLSGSGKSTVARRLERQLVMRGVFAYVLDGDNVRHGLNKDLGFGPEARTENIRRIAEVARLFVDAGAIVITAFISPYRADRDAARQIVGQFTEVHVATPLEVCEARDPKELYKKARRGEIKDFTGIDAPYEAPLAPELVIDASTDDVDACAAQVIAWLEARAILR